MLDFVGEVINSFRVSYLSIDMLPFICFLKCIGKPLQMSDLIMGDA